MGNDTLESGKWWRQPFGMLQTNLREIDVDMDVEQVIDFIQQHGANAWLIGVGGIQAQYPTDLTFQTRNPGLTNRESGDLIGDALNASHARGMRLLARMDFSKVSAQIANEHPDWLFVSPTGELQNHTHGLVSVCPSGPYYQERSFDILDEVTGRYHVDGFFVNWASFNERDYYKVYHGVCHCQNCQIRWREFAGELELPNGTEDPTYPQWLNFSNAIIEDWTDRVRTFVGERLPDAGLILGDSADIMFHEANNAVDRDLWQHETTEAVSSWVSYRPEVPVLVNSVAFVDIPYRMGSEEPARYAQYFLQCISRGGNPSTYIMGTPGKIPYLGLDVAGEITRFHQAHKEIYHGIRPVAKTGLVLPDRSQMNSSQYDEAQAEYRGLYSAMQELHVPFDIIAQEHISAMADNNGLKRYEVLLLPNLGTLTVQDVNALDLWVAAGGRLVATGSSGVAEDGTIQLESLPSERENDTITRQDLLWSSYFAPSQNRTQYNIYTGPIVPIHGTYHQFNWKNGTQGRYKMLSLAPFAPPEYAYGNLQTDERGAGINNFRNGKGIVIPFTIGRGYYELGLKVFRDFLAMILQEEGAANESMTFNIAEQVEMTLNTNGPRTIIHLINMSGARRQNFGSFLPISAGSITFSGSNITAHALVNDTMLEASDGKILLPQLGMFEVIVIEGLG